MGWGAIDRGSERRLPDWSWRGFCPGGICPGELMSGDPLSGGLLSDYRCDAASEPRVAGWLLIFNASATRCLNTHALRLSRPHKPVLGPQERVPNGHERCCCCSCWGSCCFQTFKLLKLFRFSTDRN